MESERGMLEGEGEGISLFHASVKTVIAEVLSYVDGSASPEAQVLKVCGGGGDGGGGVRE